MSSFLEAMGAFLREEGQLVQHLLGVASSTTIPGGFRSQTYSQKVSCELVLKIADRFELERQKNYIESLPSFFRGLFPQLFVLRPLPESSCAAAVMERLPGKTLHEVMVDPCIDADEKAFVFQEVMDLLNHLHKQSRPGNVDTRDVGLWLNRIRGRKVSARIEAQLDGLNAHLHLEERILLEQPIARRWIHGDAQAGNFIIDLNSGTSKVRWIDPLGGSGDGLDDYVYDLSRIFHWVCPIAEIFERKHRPTGILAKSEPFRSLTKQTQLAVVTQMENSAREFDDVAGKFWFYLYTAFHLSGKLSDFTDALSVEQIEKAISMNLNSAFNELSSTRFIRSQYAIH